MKIKLIVTLLLLSYACLATAQQNSTKIYGQILDEEDRSQGSMKVSLVRYHDSVLVKSLISDTVGRFSFEGIALGSYQIRIETIGFATYRSSALLISEDRLVLEKLVKLIPITNKLDQINIVAKKSFVEQKIDRTVVNVDALISNAGTTALDVLSKSPGVTVDQNGQISLKGKAGVNVFIDDKPTYLSGAELESYLRSLPSSSLAQIELMANPPAKYDAAGNAGIINIKTKKNNIIGFNGNVSLSVNQGELTRSNNSVNLNFRKNKINVFGNFSHNLNNAFSALDLKRVYKNDDGSPKSYFNQDMRFRRNGNTVNAKIGADFYQDEHTTFGFVFNGSARETSLVNKNTSNLLNASLLPDSIIKARNLDESVFKNIAFNLNYRHQFEKNTGDITIDLDYLNYNYQTDQTYDNYSYFPDMSLKYQDVLTGDLPSDINIYTAKADYVKPINKQWKISAGAKSSFIKTDNTANYFYTINNVTSVDYEKTNRFLYQESINSAYLNLERGTKKLSFQAGLRFENTLSDGHQFGNLMKKDSTFKKTYHDLFPTVYITYKLDTLAKHQIGFNYGRRIERPLYRQLNPFYSPLDKFTYYLGNPFLRPTFIQVFELSHTFKSKITTTFGYSRLKDQVNETIQIIDGIYYSTPANIGKGTIKSVAVNADFQLASWLGTHTYARLDHIVTETDFYTGYLKTKGTYFTTNANLQFKISKSWNAETSFAYNSRLSTVQFLLRSNYEFGVGIQKKFSEKSNLKLSASDIFRTRIYGGIINNLVSTSAGWTNRNDSRNFTLTYAYRFGKSFSTSTKKSTTGAEAEKQRVS